MKPFVKQALSVSGPLLALVIVVAFFAGAEWISGTEGNFASVSSARLVGIQSIKVGIAALGMTLIIISGGIDLSAGTATAMCGCVAALCLDSGASIYWAVVAAVLAGAACGVFNGALIAGLRLVPFIITLGSMTIFLGIAKFLCEQGGTITPPRETIPDWLRSMVTQYPDPMWVAYPAIPNFGWGVWLTLGLAILVALGLHKTILGRHIFAIGSSEATARLCGVRVQSTKVLVYAIAGALFGLAGCVDIARLEKGDASAGMGLELEIIAAVVIGGGSLLGGRGSVVGTLCGVLIMGVINHGCTALELENQVENILLGVIIIAAVYVDRIRSLKSGHATSPSSA
ncbi:monosaccharide ABC transporter membrane protein, CUT2 family [Neorhodopirellula lusitana]|uniref:Monosaccharide ABC transporter membrane protein, CUT2 family n=1 Tax=Neorhodopirellula lusitana TaxID=445327 RepID=A0ABY1QHD5_9BACT|nr:ABC transporter permease [Neorhodopirellula lusitana]SMP71628.1 monosaccharide ABC transporter membrane protein, CUT2 family [Neorhodopirellula lusitana]